MSKPKKCSIGQLKPTVLSYKWEIENFCTGCKKIGEYINSPIFSSIDHGKNLRWHLKLYPKGNREEDKGYLSLFLVNAVDEMETYIVESITLSILNDKHDKSHVQTTHKIKFDNENWGNSKFIHRNIVMDAKYGLLKDDTLTILCEIIFDPTLVTDDYTSSSDEESFSDEDKVVFVAKTYEANYKQELNDFEKLLETKSFSDVTFMVGRKKMFVHKAILASRSPVFQAMFESDMKENKDNVVRVTDIKYEVMEELFRFIYASKVNNIKSIASDLILAADKYSILGLKTLCEKTLHDDLTVGNAIEYLNLSDACNTTQLKSQVIEFIVTNRKDIVNRPNSSLFIRILCAK